MHLKPYNYFKVHCSFFSGTSHYNGKLTGAGLLNPKAELHVIHAARSMMHACTQ
jgi:hypothetical protein